MSSYNVALVQSMVSNGSVGSRENNNLLYPRVAANHALMSEITSAKQRIVELLEYLDTCKHKPPKTREAIEALAATPSTIEELRQRINALNATATVKATRDVMRQMVESNMSLVVDKVESYIRSFPTLAYLSDDLTSEGFVGLTVAVNKMSEQEPPESPNPTGYISHWILYHIGKVADRETAMGSSSRTVQRKRDDGIPLPLHVALPTNLEMETYDDPGIRLFELRDEILGCCESDEDRVIVDMREKGYVDSDIAKTLNLPYTTVYLMRRELYARFLAKSGMKGEV